MFSSKSTYIVHYYIKSINVNHDVDIRLDAATGDYRLTPLTTPQTGDLP